MLTRSDLLSAAEAAMPAPIAGATSLSRSTIIEATIDTVVPLVFQAFIDAVNNVLGDDE